MTTPVQTLILSIAHLTVVCSQGALPTYYAIENLQTAQIIRRGATPSQGVTANELILAPRTLFRVWVYDPAKQLIGHRDIYTPTAGMTFSIGSVPLRIGRALDRDQDGLSDDAEFILGTNPTIADTNGDGISDGAAIRLGLDPVTGLRTGVIGGTATATEAVDVAARDDVAVVANRSGGVTIFNIFNQLPPLIIGQVDTPGDAQRVALAGDKAAVADGASGLAIIDIGDPSAAAIAHQVRFGAGVAAVAASVETAYAALADGQLAAVDLVTGAVRHRITLPEPAWDAAVGGDVLYAIGPTKLFVIPLTPGEFKVTRSVVSAQAGSGRKLFVGTKTIYAPFVTGYNLFDITNPLEPIALPAVQTAQRNWKFAIATGSGLALAAIEDPGVDLAQSLSLYNVGADQRQSAFLTSFSAPAYIQAAAIYNGQAYLAAGASGLLVLNYRSADTARTPPAVTLVSPMFSDGAEAGRPELVRAEVTDDVQVRNVEFYVNGAKAATDGNYPFEHRFRAPPLSGSGAFTVQARVSDTGGNTTWSDARTAALSPDLTPPYVLGSLPASGGIAVSPPVLTLFFSEAVQAATIGPSTVRLAQAGPDGVAGTADDVAITGFSTALSGEGATATVLLSSPLLPGRHQLRVEPGVTDLAGFQLPSAYTSVFAVLDGMDDDGDGVPNDVELALGFNPNNPDSDADGIADGAEDPDADQLGIASELVVGTNPGIADTDGDGVLDGLEDPDLDGVNNANEIKLGLNPFREDSDGDGWYDEAEITSGSDPASAASRPSVTMAARPLARVLRPTTALPAGQSFGAVVALPPTKLLRPVTTPPAEINAGAVVALPRVKLLRPVTTSPAEFNESAVMALPAVRVDTRTP